MNKKIEDKKDTKIIKKATTNVEKKKRSCKNRKIISKSFLI
jgi:hypothetical protein